MMYLTPPQFHHTTLCRSGLKSEMTPVKKQAMKIQDGGAGSSCTTSPTKAGTAWDYTPGL